MDSFREFMVKLSSEITSEELEQLTFYFNVPKGLAEKIHVSGLPVRLFQYLEQETLLEPNKFEALIKGLKSIRRSDLVRKIAEHVRSQSQHGESGGSSNTSTFEPQPYFEREGYRVEVHNGNQLNDDNCNVVAMKLGNKYHLELSNNRETGCVADIKLYRAFGENQQVIGIKLDAHQQNLCIYTNDQRDLLRLEGDPTSVGTLSTGIQCLEISFSQQRKIYFQTRELDINSYHCVLSEVMCVCIPEASATKVDEVLTRLKAQHTDVAGSCLYNGHRVLQRDDLLSFPSNDHDNITNPQLLLKETEQIFVKHGDGNQFKCIKASPRQSSIESIKQQACGLFGCSEDNCELTVDGEVVIDIMECFKARYVQIKRRKTAYRGAAALSCFNPLPKSARVALDFDDDDDIGKMVAESSSKFRDLLEGIETKRSPKTTRKAGDIGTKSATSSKEELNPISGDKMATCPDNKVVIVIYLVPIVG